MAFTYADLINQSLVDLGALKPGATPSTTIRDEAFLRLQQLWEGWGIDQTISNAQYHQVFALGASTIYTLGPSGTLVSFAPPIRVYAAESVFGSFKSPVKVLSFKDFTEQVQDSLGTSSVLATHLAADNGYPNINLRVHPTPVGGGLLYIDYWGLMAAFAAVGDTVAVAPAFSDALHWNLAMALLPQYGRIGIDATALAANAAASLGKIQQLSRQALGQPVLAQTGSG